MNKLLNNLLGMYKQAKLNKKAEEDVEDVEDIEKWFSVKLDNDQAKEFTKLLTENNIKNKSKKEGEEIRVSFFLLPSSIGVAQGLLAATLSKFPDKQASTIKKAEEIKEKVFDEYRVRYIPANIAQRDEKDEWLKQFGGVIEFFLAENGWKIASYYEDTFMAREDIGITMYSGDTRKDDLILTAEQRKEIQDWIKSFSKQSSKNTKLTKKAGWKVLTPKDLTEEVKDEFLKDSIKEYAGHVKREDFYFVKGIKEKEDDQFSYEWEEGMFGEWRTNVKGEKWYSLTDLGDDWDYIYLIKEDKLYKMPNRESLTDFGVVSSKRVKLTKKADYTKEEIEMINKEKEKQIECGEMIWKAKNALYGNKVQECKEVVKQMPENCKLNFVVNVKREGEDKYYKKEINEIFKVIPQSLINEADEILKENPNTLYVSEWYRKSSKAELVRKQADEKSERVKKDIEKVVSEMDKSLKVVFRDYGDGYKIGKKEIEDFIKGTGTQVKVLDSGEYILVSPSGKEQTLFNDDTLYIKDNDVYIKQPGMFPKKLAFSTKKQAEKVLTLKEAIGKDESEFKNMEDIVDYMNHLPLNANKSSWTVEGFGGNSIDVENLSNGEKATIKLKKNFNSRYATRQNKLFKSATIKHENGVYNVYSESGKCLGKGYKTKEEAEKRLKQVEYFKNKKSSLSTKPYFQTSKEMVKDALDLWHSRQNLYNKKYNTDEELGEAEIEQKNKEYNFLIKWNYEYGDFMNTNNDILYKLITNQISIEQAVEKINAFFEQVYNYDPLNPHKKKASFPNKRTSLKQVVISKMAKIKK